MYSNFDEMVKGYEATTGTQATAAAKKVLSYFWKNRNNPERTLPLLSALETARKAQNA